MHRSEYHRKTNHPCRHSRAVEVCEWVERHSRVLSVSEESGSGYRKTHLIAATSARILTAPVGRVWRFTHFCSVASLLEKWFTCHHSFPYFFIKIFPTAFSFRSRMTGRQVIPFCKKLLFIFLLILTPFVSSADTFPVSGDSLRSLFFSLCIHLASEYHGKAIHPCRHSWAVEVCEWVERHSRVLSVSEESGSGYRKTHLIAATSARILTAPVGRVWRFTHFYSVALLLEKWFACFPTSGDSFLYESFRYFCFSHTYFLFFCFCSYKKYDFFLP